MISRRSLLASSVAGLGAGALARTEAQQLSGDSAPVSPKDNLKITKLETFLVKPRWLFLKIHTNAGIVGLGEPYLESRALASAAAVKEVEPYLIGKDPRLVVHHWQNLYRNPVYHGGLIMTSVISGIDQALWDIKGKALGVPVCELLGGPTRRRVRTYMNAHSIEEAQQQIAAGYTAVKLGPGLPRRGKYLETPGNIRRAAETLAQYRKALGEDIDIAVDFHGAVQPMVSKVLIKALEPYQPAWIEDPVNCENVDVLAEVAHSTYIPICVGERLTAKWSIREVLEKRAAGLLNPDMSHAGGITELLRYAGLAETYYTPIAPHVPLGPIAFAAAVQLAAAIPNFLMTEHVTLGEGYLKKPFVVSQGYVDLPTAPGLGIELDEEALADKLGGPDWHPGEAFDEDDGSVVDQ
jgi:galactonate dehydratase